MIQTRMNHHFAAVCLCTFVLILGGALSAQGTAKVYPHHPFLLHVDLEKDFLLVYAYSHLYAQDLTTGNQRWSLPLEGRVVDFNDNDLLLGTENSLRLYDKATGRLLRQMRDPGARSLRSANFIGNSLWIEANFGNTLVFTPEGRTLRPPPVPGDTMRTLSLVGWMPDGETLLLVDYDSGDGTLTTYFWEPGSNRIEEGYSFTSENQKFFVHLSTTGKAVIVENRTLRLIDARTGDTLRNLGKSGPQFTNDGLMLANNETGDGIIVTSLETGDTVATISREGHTFGLYTIRTQGKNWLLSADSRRHCWLWPLETGAEPTLVWEAPVGDYAPGGLMAFRPPYALFGTGRNTISAYRLDGMEPVATWRTPDGHRIRFTTHTCTQMRHALAHAYQEDGQGENSIDVAQVYIPDTPEPVSEVLGNPLALSPNGRYLAVQVPDRGPVHLVDIDSGAVLAEVKKTGDGHGFARATFSGDNRFMAASIDSHAMIVALGGDFPQWTVHTQGSPTVSLFSPDGTYFAGGGSGMAAVYTSETGEAVPHFFVEPEKVARRYGSRDHGFVDTALRFGRNLMGRFVTDDSEVPWIGIGFAKDGKQLITLAAGQILRVWDIESGKMVRTIRTGLPERRNASGRINNHLVLSENGAYAFAYNKDGFAPAALWEIGTGKALSRYNIDFPAEENIPIAVADDGSAIYLRLRDGLYHLPGITR